MLTFNSKLVVNTREVYNHYETNKKQFLLEAKEIGLNNINSETPVITGNLRSGNKATISKDGVEFFNAVDYFIFVHNGTTYKSANPYMMRGLTISKAEFVSSLIGNLRV